jgi:hypothetical protein
VIVEIKAGVISQDRQTTSDQHRNKKEVEEVAVTHPQWKTMWAGEVVWGYLRDGRNMRKSH